MLQSSSLIKFSDIRTELGVASQAPFLLGAAIAGEYAPLTCSVPRPDLINPGHTSEWYSYDHSEICAGGCPTVTGASASMEPCTGGTINDYMGATVSLDDIVEIDSNFTVDVSYTSLGASCSGSTSTISLSVTVLAGSSWGSLSACSGGYFPSGAEICSVCISSWDNPNVSIGAEVGCGGEALCSPTPPPPASGNCFNVTYPSGSVPIDLYAKYRAFSDDIVTDTLVGSLLSIDNGNGTYTSVVCASTITPYNIPVFVQGGSEIAWDYSWIQTGTCTTEGQCIPT